MYGKSQNGSTRSTVYPLLDSEIFSEATKGMYRCFTVIPKDDIVEKGIHTVILFPGMVGKVPLSKVYFHQPEAFRRGHSDIAGYRFTMGDDNRHQGFTINYEVHTMLKEGSTPPCEDSPDYSFDMCIHRYIQSESRAKFGCTAPNGLNNSQICTDSIMAKQVEALQFIIESQNKTEVCPLPCKTYVIQLSKIKETGEFSTRIVLRFSEDVVMTDERFGYEFLSLMAEVGGYVGLFLGVSVNQVSTLIELLFERYNQKKITRTVPRPH